MDQLVVAVDFDNTMCDFSAHQREVIYKDFGITIGDEYDAPKTDVPWKDYGYASWWRWLERHTWLWALAPAIDGAVGGVHALRAAGHRPELLTAKPVWAEAEVWKWLSRWKPAFEGVQFVGVDEPKSEASEADVLIDDRVNVVEEWVHSDSSRMGVLFGQHWNQEWTPEPRIIRVDSWPAALEAVRVFEMS